METPSQRMPTKMQEQRLEKLRSDASMMDSAVIALSRLEQEIAKIVAEFRSTYDFSVPEVRMYLGPFVTQLESFGRSVHTRYEATNRTAIAKKQDADRYEQTIH